VFEKRSSQRVRAVIFIRIVSIDYFIAPLVTAAFFVGWC
jgi:hypothetical protein